MVLPPHSCDIHDSSSTESREEKISWRQCKKEKAQMRKREEKKKTAPTTPALALWPPTNQRQAGKPGSPAYINSRPDAEELHNTPVKLADKTRNNTSQPLSQHTTHHPPTAHHMQQILPVPACKVRYRTPPHPSNPNPILARLHAMETSPRKCLGNLARILDVPQSGR